MKKYRILIGVVALAVISVVLQRIPHSPDFTVADKLAQQMNAELDAQTPSMCCYQPGQVVNIGSGSATTGSATGPGSIILAAPATTARHYLVSASCMNATSQTTVAAIWDSGTIGTSPTVTIKRYVPCPPNDVAGEIVFPSPIQFRLGSAVGMSTVSTAGTGALNGAYFSGESFTSR